MSVTNVRVRTPASDLVGIRMVIIGIRLQTWTQVIVNRCISKIIARDLSLVASWLYRMAVTRTWVTCRRYIIPLFRCRPPGLHKLYKREGKERETKNETIILGTQSYEPIGPTTDRYSSMATFRRIRCTGKLHLHWLVVKTHADAICTRPWSKEEKKRRAERNKKTSKSDPVSISRLPNPCSNDHHSRSSYIPA